MYARLSALFIYLAIAVLAFLIPYYAEAARLLLQPASATFYTGSTFDVDLILDTEGEMVNAFDIALIFPIDKLQISSQITGRSIAEVWVGPPQYSNSDGKVTFSGGIPSGINVKSGLIARLTFRARNIGIATIKFADTSRVLSHDGAGTDILTQTLNGVYKIELPPPAGPIVASETHQDPNRWYQNRNAILRWEPVSDTEGYSYVKVLYIANLQAEFTIFILKQKEMELGEERPILGST
jgi:hypothetical protein